jgi:alkaline phosphatase D
MRAYPSLRRVVAGGIAAGVLALVPAASAVAKPFGLGVAANEVTKTSAILWTRADQVGEVTLRVTSPPQRGLREFHLQADLSNDRTVQKHVTGLVPGRTYLYRFVQNGETSRTGRFVTAPEKTADATIRFAFSGDADAERAAGQSNIFYNDLKGNNGLGAENFGVYRQMAAEDNHFNVNLGDVIYSDSEVPGRGALASTVAAKRAKYRQNLAVPASKTFRAATGVYNQWDDREFVNDFTPPENGLAIYQRGLKAFREYMPINYSAADGLYLRQRWGRNLVVFRQDSRSFRSAKASANHTCDNPQSGQPDLAPTAPQSTRNLFALAAPSLSAPVSQACKDRIKDPNRTFLGLHQFDRFVKDIANSKAVFKVVLNEVPIQQYYAFPYDRWEGYEAERQRLLHALENRGVKNVVFLTTDNHATFMNVIRHKTLEQGGPKDSPYSELATGPVSTMTGEREIDRATGKQGNGALVDAAFFSQPPPNGPGMQCSNQNIYSYAEVNVTSQLLTVTAKDGHGTVVRDQSDGATPCVLTVPAQ